MLTVYGYRGCGTCKKAYTYLKENNIPFEEKAIRETPPSIAELTLMLSQYDGKLNKLFNTSGGTYREMNLKEKLPTMRTEDALQLLHENGNLVKRPFAILGNKGIVGFKEEVWDNFLEK